MKYAVSLNQGGPSSPTVIGEFIFQQKEGLHVWKGKFATTMKELSDQINEAVQFMPTFADPFLMLRVVEIEAESVASTTPNPDDLSQPSDEIIVPSRADGGTAFAGEPEAPIKLRELKEAKC